MDIEKLFERPGDPSNTSPERRILIATLDCIAEQGLEGATVRVIAAKAGLNAAAVNYYYRSKEKLVDAALRHAWIHVSEDIDRIAVETSGGREGLETAIAFLIEGAHRYPTIIRAIVVEHPSLRREAAAFFKRLFEELCARAGATADPGIGTTLLLAFSSFIGLAPEAVAALTGRNPADPAARRALAAEVVPMIFPTRRA